MARISKRIVDAARPGAKPAFVWDDTLPGFGLRVLLTGAKSYVFQYRTAEGRTRRATIGKVGSLTPEQARALADEMSRKVKGGGDPLEDKRRNAPGSWRGGFRWPVLRNSLFGAVDGAK